MSGKSSQGEQRKRVVWADAERLLFVKLVKKHGTDFTQFLRHFPGKSFKQIKNFWMNNKF